MASDPAAQIGDADRGLEPSDDVETSTHNVELTATDASGSRVEPEWA